MCRWIRGFLVQSGGSVQKLSICCEEGPIAVILLCAETLIFGLVVTMRVKRGSIRRFVTDHIVEIGVYPISSCHHRCHGKMDTRIEVDGGDSPLGNPA